MLIACFICFCAAFHRNFCSVGYRNFCSEATEISVTHTTEISVALTTEISVKSSAKAEETSLIGTNTKLTVWLYEIGCDIKFLEICVVS